MQSKIARLLRAIFPAEGNESCTNCSEEFPLDQFVWVFAVFGPNMEKDFQEAVSNGDLSQEEIDSHSMKVNFCFSCWDGGTGDYYRKNYPNYRVDDPRK